MMKKILTTAMLAAALVGAAPQAMAADDGTISVNGNGAGPIFGNSAVHASLIQGTPMRPCVGLPAKVNVQSVVALINVGVQDIPVLSAPQNQQCTKIDVSVQEGDDALSHLVDDIPVLSGNGSNNH